MNAFKCSSHSIAFFLLKYADGLSVNKLCLFRETKDMLNLYYHEKSYYSLGCFFLSEHEMQAYVAIISIIYIQNGDILRKDLFINELKWNTAVIVNHSEIAEEAS